LQVIIEHGNSEGFEITSEARNLVLKVERKRFLVRPLQFSAYKSIILWETFTFIRKT